MKLWTDERLAKFSKAEANILTRKHPGILFLIICTGVIACYGLIDDFRIHVLGASSSVEWWMRYLSGVIAGIIALFEHRRIWNKVDTTLGANKALQAIGDKSPQPDR